jgi:predicted RND superfamily exporter protein
MHFLQRRILKAVLSVTAHPRVTLFIVAATLFASIMLAATRLTLSSDQNKLFSSTVPFFRNYLEFTQKFPENEAVYIVVENKDGTKPAVKDWTAVADAITNRLRNLPDAVVAVDSHIPIEQLGRQGILFENPAKLPGEFADAKNQIVPLAQIWGEKPGVTAILGSSPMERFVSSLSLAPAGDRAMAADFITTLSTSWTDSIQHPADPIEVGHAVPDLSTLGSDDPSRLGYYYVPNEVDRSRSQLLVRVYPRRDFTSLTGVTRIVDAIRDAAVDAAKPYGDFNIGVTGRPALEADEMRVSDEDSHRAEILALIVVFIGLVAMLRSLWLALAAEISLGVGIGWTFGYATLARGELNLLSIVFLIALIGIGMDYLVQILSRYRLEYRRYQRPAAVWVRVFQHVGPPIQTACLGAACAFFVSIFTDFQGAADLGIVAGGGLLLCLITGYTVLPALLTIFPPAIKPYPADMRYTARPRFAKAERLMLPMLWILALVLGIPAMQKTHFDPGLIELQPPNLESVKLIRTLQTWFAVVLVKQDQPASAGTPQGDGLLNPTPRTLDELRALDAAVSKQPAVDHSESILSAFNNADWLKQHAGEMPQIHWTTPTPIVPADFSRLATKARKLADLYDPPTSAAVPGSPNATATQAASDPTPSASSEPYITTQPTTASQRAAAKSLRDFANALESPAAGSATNATANNSNSGPAPIAARLSDWQNVFVDELKNLLDQFQPVQPDIANLPKSLREHYVSPDGYYAFYILPKNDLWVRDNLRDFEQHVEAAVATVPSAPPVTGITSNVYDTTASIHHSFYSATFYALAMIFILVLLDFRKIMPTLMAISVLALGLPMLLALMGIFDVSWNFANFFGLPILIGAGHEYGVFMVHRYLEAKKDPRRVWKTWDVSDRALLLCAFITTSSFGFFWFTGRHLGLRSLGLVMCLGTACIYLAAVVVLRPILIWKLGRMKPKEDEGFPVLISATDQK